jgi:hypothetical protein
LDPTIIRSSFNSNKDEVTIVTSNVLAITHISTTTHLCRSPPTLTATARHIFGTPTPQYLNALTIATNQAIADTGTMSIFIMDGLVMVNKRVARTLLTINLPDGKQIMSMHICNMIIPGLPTVLTGHIIPSLMLHPSLGFGRRAKQDARSSLTIISAM